MLHLILRHFIQLLCLKLDMISFSSGLHGWLYWRCNLVIGISLEGLHKRLEASNLDRSELEKAKLDQTKDFPNGIPECGADTLRFALVSYIAQSDKINLDVLRVIGYRQWCNKLWNAIRFAMMKLGDDYAPLEKLDVKFMPSDASGYFLS